MNEPTPVSPKKDKTWQWIVVAIAVILLCCLLVLVGAVSFGLWKGHIRIPGMNIGDLPSLPSPAVPYQNVGPKKAPAGTPEPLTVEPYKPQLTDHYPSLQDLVPNWQSPTGPGTTTWNVTVNSNQPVLLFEGWCASQKTTLDQNFQHMKYLFEVDGKSLSTDKLNQQDQQTPTQACRDFTGIIRSWPQGSHTIKITLHMDAKINDGWSDYPAGDYVEIYNIIVP
jgi:hypothetical protein